MDEKGDLPSVVLPIAYLSLGVSALRLCALAYEFWQFCYHRRQERESEEHQEFKLAEEDAEDITTASLAAAGVVGSSSTCVVCLDEFKEGDLCRRLRCGHVFHPCCIQTWLNKGRSKTCPLCRMKFLPREEEEEPHSFSRV